jgi:hypothetical protein
VVSQSFGTAAYVHLLAIGVRASSLASSACQNSYRELGVSVESLEVKDSLSLHLSRHSQLLTVSVRATRSSPAKQAFFRNWHLFPSSHMRRSNSPPLNVCLPSINRASQALCSKANTNSQGPLLRNANGIQMTRLNLLLAVLTKVCKLKLYTQDVYVNITAGVQVKGA